MLFKSEATRRRITLISGLVLAIGMGQSVISGFLASNNTPAGTAEAVSTSAIETVDLARGYEIVLEREPYNQTALKGLVQVYMARNQLSEVIEPLEKLAELNPDDETYPQLLETITAEIQNSQSTPSETEEATP